MRNALLTLVLTLISLHGYCQCESFPYRNLIEFESDTTAYVMYNYMERSECHKGKTVNDFLNEFELKIESFLLSVDTDNPENLIGIVLFPYEVNEVGRRNHFQLETHAVRLYFESPVKSKPLLKKADKWGKNRWNRKIFKELKDYKIKLTRSLIYSYSPYKEKYKDKIED